MERLLDFDSDFDVGLLDQVITIFYDPVHPDVRPLPSPLYPWPASSQRKRASSPHRLLVTGGGLPVRPGVPPHRHAQFPQLPILRARGPFCRRCHALW